MLPAVPCFKVLSLGTVPLALDILWAHVLIANNGQRRMFLVNAAALGVNLVLSLPLTQLHGVCGAAGAALAAYTASALGACVAARGLLGGRTTHVLNPRIMVAMGRRSVGLGRAAGRLERFGWACCLRGVGCCPSGRGRA